MRPPRPDRRTPALVAAVAALTACTPGATSTGEDGDVAIEASAPATVTVPPERLTPFCQAMIDLSDELENDPPDDVTGTIIETYERIQDDVPPEIRADFDVVLAQLRGEEQTVIADDEEPVASTTVALGPPPTDEAGSTVPVADPFLEEGWTPEEEPALRLNAFVDFECRDVKNNPGPPATQPLSETTVAEE